jgi:MFS family permease
VKRNPGQASPSIPDFALLNPGYARYTAELFPTQIRGAAVGASFTFGLAAASLAPMIMGWIATASSIATGLPLLALSFLMLAPPFIWFAPDMTQKELTDFVGEKAG